MFICRCGRRPGHWQPGETPPGRPHRGCRSALNDLTKLSEQPHLRGLSMHPGEVMARTGGSSFWLWHHDSTITNTALQQPWWLWFLPLPDQAWMCGRGEEAIIRGKSSNLVMSCGDKWRIGHLSRNIDYLPCCRRRFPIRPAVYIRWHLQISGVGVIEIISSHAWVQKTCSLSRCYSF